MSENWDRGGPEHIDTLLSRIDDLEAERDAAREEGRREGIREALGVVDADAVIEADTGTVDAYWTEQGQRIQAALRALLTPEEVETAAIGEKDE